MMYFQIFTAFIGYIFLGSWVLLFYIKASKPMKSSGAERFLVFTFWPLVVLLMILLVVFWAVPTEIYKLIKTGVLHK